MQQSAKLVGVGRVLVRVWRLVALLGVAWLIMTHHARLRVDGDRRIGLEEVRELLPEAASLDVALGEEGALAVRDAEGELLGRVMRTSPDCEAIIGYIGPADVLMVFDPESRLKGIRLRHSWDTPTHVRDVVAEKWFWRLWDGQTQAELGRLDLEEAGFEGVAGATMTSRCVAESMVMRAGLATAADTTPPPMRWRLRDGLLLGIMLFGMLLTAKVVRLSAPWRLGWQLAVIGIVGWYLGDLLTQSLMLGWAAHGVPWRSAPGLVCLGAAALLVPWASGRPFYCAQICPHGALQQVLHRRSPKSWRRPALSRAWWALPPVLLAGLLTAAMLRLEVNPAAWEPFDAWLWPAAGIGTLIVAAVSLLLTLWVPSGYCRYGCPTGAVLRFIRSDGAGDRLALRDLGAAALLALAWALSHWHDPLMAAIHGLP